MLQWKHREEDGNRRYNYCFHTTRAPRKYPSSFCSSNWIREIQPDYVRYMPNPSRTDVPTFAFVYMGFNPEM